MTVINLVATLPARSVAVTVIGLEPRTRVMLFVVQEATPVLVATVLLFAELVAETVATRSLSVVVPSRLTWFTPVANVVPAGLVMLRIGTVVSYVTVIGAESWKL